MIDGVELEGLEVVLVNQNRKKDAGIYKAGVANKYKSAIHIFTHGATGGFVGVGGEWVHNDNLSGYTTVLKKSDMWKTSSKASDFVVVLHSCRTGDPPIKVQVENNL